MSLEYEEVSPLVRSQARVGWMVGYGVMVLGMAVGFGLSVSRTVSLPFSASVMFGGGAMLGILLLVGELGWLLPRKEPDPLRVAVWFWEVRRRAVEATMSLEVARPEFLESFDSDLLTGTTEKWAGLGCTHLGDFVTRWEGMTLGTRVLTRVYLADGGTVRVPMVLSKVGDGEQGKVEYSIVSNFGEARLVTRAVKGKAPVEEMPWEELVELPARTMPAEVLRVHRERVSERMSGGAEVMRVCSMEEVADSIKRQLQLRLAHLQENGFASGDDFRRFMGAKGWTRGCEAVAKALDARCVEWRERRAREV